MVQLMKTKEKGTHMKTERISYCIINFPKFYSAYKESLLLDAEERSEDEIKDMIHELADNQSLYDPFNLTFEECGYHSFGFQISEIKRHIYTIQYFGYALIV